MARPSPPNEYLVLTLGEGNCSPGSSRLYRLGVSQTQKDERRGYALRSVRHQLSFRTESNRFHSAYFLDFAPGSYTTSKDYFAENLFYHILPTDDKVPKARDHSDIIARMRRLQQKR